MGLLDQFLQSNGYGREALMQPKPKPESGLQGMAMMMAMRGRGGGGGGAGLPQGSGGIDELIWQQPGHWTHLHMGDADLPMKKIARWAERKGFDVGELEGFRGEGQVSSGHSTNSMHYAGNAMDLNYNGGGRWANEKDALDWAYRRLQRRYG